MDILKWHISKGHPQEKHPKQDYVSRPPEKVIELYGEFADYEQAKIQYLQDQNLTPFEAFSFEHFLVWSARLNLLSIAAGKLVDTVISTTSRNRNESSISELDESAKIAKFFMDAYYRSRDERPFLAMVQELGTLHLYYNHEILGTSTKSQNHQIEAGFLYTIYCNNPEPTIMPQEDYSI